MFLINLLDFTKTIHDSSELIRARGIIVNYTLKYDDGTSYRSFRMLIVYLGQTSRSCIPQACYGVAVKVLTSFTTNLLVFQCNFFQLSLV